MSILTDEEIAMIERELGLNESHFSVGDEVKCKESGMEGEVVAVDDEEKGKYYTVKREDGKTVKYAPNELEKELDEEVSPEVMKMVQKHMDSSDVARLKRYAADTRGLRPDEQRDKAKIIAVARGRAKAAGEVKESKMDPVNKKALKKDFDDRKDQDIDNDGDTDNSDEYLHMRRKAISKALSKK